MNDFKFAIRRLLKSPGFTIVAVLTLALGIGACTATFSLVNAVLLRSLPFSEPERLVWIENLPRPDGGTPTLSGDTFVDWRTQARSFESLAAFDAFFEANGYTVTGEGEPQRLRGVRVSQRFLDVLGVRPVLGRGFVDEEFVLNGRRAAVVSHTFWQQEFGGAKDVIGRAVTINGESVQIVGVLPPSDHLDVLFSPGTRVDLLLPFPLTEETVPFAGRRWGNTLYAIGRLNPGVFLSQAQEELTVISERLNTSHPERVAQNGGLKFGARVTWLKAHVRGSFRAVFLLLSGAVLCVLLIACVNISNLLLARANGRRQEVAVRIALGAGRWRLVRQIMMESLLLALAGCVLGVFGAYFGIALVPRLEVFGIPLLHSAAIDPATVMVAVALACVAALACGILPSLQLWRRGPAEVLREAGSRGGTGKSIAWIRRTLVTSEIALACMLLIAAGLLVRSFLGVLQVNLGFQPEHAVAWRVETSRPFNSVTDRVAFYGRLVERISALPGIDSAGLCDSLPLAVKRMWALRVKVKPYEANASDVAVVVMTDHRYLQALGVPLRAGRHFDERDSADSPPVMIINETMARTFWPGQDPIGQTAWVNSPDERTVVGVVADVRQGLEETPKPAMYLSFGQWEYFQWHSPQLVVRSTRPLQSLIPDVRAAMKEVDPTMASNEFTTLDQIVDRTIAPRRLITSLLGSFSSFALLLAAIGLYAVIAYSVGQRTREIGVRVALGAQRGDVLWLVLAEGLRLAGIGVVLGLAAAFLVSRVLSSQLYGVAPTDPATFVSVPLLLAAVVLVACWLPARRAIRVDPLVALRSE